MHLPGGVGDVHADLAADRVRVPGRDLTVSRPSGHETIVVTRVAAPFAAAEARDEVHDFGMTRGELVRGAHHLHRRDGLNNPVRKQREIGGQETRIASAWYRAGLYGRWCV